MLWSQVRVNEGQRKPKWKAYAQFRSTREKKIVRLYKCLLGFYFISSFFSLFWDSSHEEKFTLIYITSEYKRKIFLKNNTLNIEEDFILAFFHTQ